MHWWVREAFRTNLVRCDAGTDVYINVTQFRTISLTYNYIYIHICIYCVDFYPATHPKSPSACGNIAKIEWPKLNGQCGCCSESYKGNEFLPKLVCLPGEVICMILASLGVRSVPFLSRSAGIVCENRLGTAAAHAPRTNSRYGTCMHIHINIYICKYIYIYI